MHGPRNPRDGADGDLAVALRRARPVPAESRSLRSVPLPSWRGHSGPGSLRRCRWPVERHADERHVRARIGAGRIRSVLPGWWAHSPTTAPNKKFTGARSPLGGLRAVLHAQRRGPGADARPDLRRFRCPLLSCTAGRQREHRCSSVSGRFSGGGAHRAAPARKRDPVARAGDGQRRFAGRAARDDAGARAVLGDRLRLAQVRGETERPAELHHRDRRARHPLHPRSLPARGRAAADRHAWVAGLDHRAAEDHRAAHQSHGARRERIGRVPSGDPLAAGPRVLRQADEHGLGSRSHRASVGGADEAARLRPVRGPGRRLGRGGHADDGHSGRPGVARDSFQYAGYRPGRARRGVRAWRPAAGGSVGR